MAREWDTDPDGYDGLRLAGGFIMIILAIMAFVTLFLNVWMAGFLFVMIFVVALFTSPAGIVYSDSSYTPEPYTGYVPTYGGYSAPSGPRMDSYCNGTGRCQNCHGTGKAGWTGLTNAPGAGICPICVGTGVCRHCGGTGTERY